MCNYRNALIFTPPHAINVSVQGLGVSDLQPLSPCH